MQILHFDWLRYQRTISNSHRDRVAESVTLSLVLFLNKYNFSTCICQLYYCLFCPTNWLILKQSAHSASRLIGILPSLAIVSGLPFFLTGMIIPPAHLTKLSPAKGTCLPCHVQYTLRAESLSIFLDKSGRGK